MAFCCASLPSSSLWARAYPWRSPTSCCLVRTTDGGGGACSALAPRASLSSSTLYFTTGTGPPWAAWCRARSSSATLCSPPWSSRWCWAVCRSGPPSHSFATSIVASRWTRCWIWTNNYSHIFPHSTHGQSSFSSCFQNNTTLTYIYTHTHTPPVGSMGGATGAFTLTCQELLSKPELWLLEYGKVSWINGHKGYHVNKGENGIIQYKGMMVSHLEWVWRTYYRYEDGFSCLMQRGIICFQIRTVSRHGRISIVYYPPLPQIIMATHIWWIVNQQVFYLQLLSPTNTVIQILQKKSKPHTAAVGKRSDALQIGEMLQKCWWEQYFFCRFDSDVNIF